MKEILRTTIRLYAEKPADREALRLLRQVREEQHLRYADAIVAAVNSHYGQARQGGGRCWLLYGWQCAGGAVWRGGLLYAGIGQAGGAGMVCSRPGGGVLAAAGGARRALAAAGGAV